MVGLHEKEKRTSRDGEQTEFSLGNRDLGVPLAAHTLSTTALALPPFPLSLFPPVDSHPVTVPPPVEMAVLGPDHLHRDCRVAALVRKDAWAAGERRGAGRGLLPKHLDLEF